MLRSVDIQFKYHVELWSAKHNGTTGQKEAIHEAFLVSKHLSEHF